MLSYYNRRMIQVPIIVITLVLVAASAWLFSYNWAAGAGLLTLTIFLLLFLYLAERKMHEDVQKYVATLSYRLQKVGEETLQELPIGILLYNKEYTIEWANAFLTSYFQEETLVGESLYEVAEPLLSAIKSGKEAMLNLNDKTFRVVSKPDERLLYFFDVTEEERVARQFREEKTTLSIIFLDNYDDLTQGMDDQTKSSLNSLVTSMLNGWAKKHGMFLKRVSSERFFTVMNERILAKLEEDKFSILDEVREETAKHYAPLTLSIGIGQGVVPLPELGDLAQSSLDLALGRGGDQAAIKQGDGKVKFYGGKTNPTEKRTRVRARVISHALRDIVTESDKVIVMGHKYPDMDAVGASMGIRHVAELNGREGYIVVDPAQVDTAVKRLLNELKEQNPELHSRIITPEEALEIATNRTLLVVVDTHKPSLVIEGKLLSRAERVVVIDHHRRGEEFIKNPLLVYMEPYASSTAELVTELLEYQPKTKKISMLESTALLAGIIVDTKSFSLRTGARTFDAAAYLRTNGADTILVQKFLKEDIGTYIQRSQLIETVYFYKDGLAIAKGDDDYVYDSVLIAQAADTILTMNGVQASFVIARRSEEMIGISARSLGEVNVQIIMEQLNGGGHLTNAATQIRDASVEDAEMELCRVIDEVTEGGNEE
ncbi:DHH family phosphoesterase [Domibacillus sp. DTU_2020_1001157_1_SI_ALB_TIR_016]|uniref:DHH family phosphoesterase n=1 Tax=Domibacillus sp. DTU_2020_1001157_1_SI_ALB_TIR_016 TaxID=3077789 RepID=UPI0028E2A079|nr:DHH family phosphoesterase [Domibacillus sp. DTU_2020_1001157_1_SI_ALB_TIR_016]WNS80868.1 DHH family phosphoesterase [Domibacillus sp. DTU_2020_1001157_1_SI_ALB_TIR_016]